MMRSSRRCKKRWRRRRENTLNGNSGCGKLIANQCVSSSRCLLCRRKLEKLRKKLKASLKEVHDLQSEFQIERDDFLETIRGSERELKLFTSIAKRYRTSRLPSLSLPALIRAVILLT